jgi:putative component of membrane protein insertase Oxa1/YidC/SpoIIIJ protein YidD
MSVTATADRVSRCGGLLPGGVALLPFEKYEDDRGVVA